MSSLWHHYDITVFYEQLSIMFDAVQGQKLTTSTDFQDIRT